MKKIKPVDRKTAQSIVSFACPCIPGVVCPGCENSPLPRASGLNVANGGSQSINYS